MFDRQDEWLSRTLKPRFARFLEWHKGLGRFWQLVWVCVAVFLAMLVWLLP